MIEPIKAAFGNYMGAFYAGIVPTTNGLQEYVARGLAKSIVWAPSRMVDAVEDMLFSWQRNDTDGAPTQPAKMPITFVAIAKDYTPSGRDYTRQISEQVEVILPDDIKERDFKVSVIAGDVRAQVVFCAHDEPSARSLAAQFLLYLDNMENRRFFATHTFAGQETTWPVQIESPDTPAMSIQTDVKNLTMLACDITLKASIPLFNAPSGNEPNDGKGTVGNSADPSGYQVVVQVNYDKEDVL